MKERKSTFGDLIITQAAVYSTVFGVFCGGIL